MADSRLRGRSHNRGKHQVPAQLHGAVARLHAAVLHGSTAQRGYTAMTKDTRLNDAEMLARALSRWEGEGGALAPTGAADSIDESELRVLARLGAAVLDAWAELSPALRRRSFSAQGRSGARRSRARERSACALFARTP